MPGEITYSGEIKVTLNGVETVYDSFGDSYADAILFISGLVRQLIAWDEGFIERIVDEGYRAIRFDKRDAGRATSFEAAGTPSMFSLIKAVRGRPAPPPPYRLGDMAADTLALLDVLDLCRVHLVGISMGGMIAQTIAIQHPERVKSMTLIMSAAIGTGLPVPGINIIRALIQPFTSDREKYLQEEMKIQQALYGGGLAVDEDYVRMISGKFFDRGGHPGAGARQLAAIFSSGSRVEALKKIDIPTLVIHGRVDPLIPVRFGRQLAEIIPNARLMLVPAMGHALPPALFADIAEAIVRHVSQAVA